MQMQFYGAIKSSHKSYQGPNNTHISRTINIYSLTRILCTEIITIEKTSYRSLCHVLSVPWRYLRKAYNV